MARDIRVNRIILSDLPRIYNFEEFEESDAYGIFSSGEVIGAVASVADKLGIDLTVTEGTDLPRRLSTALESDDESIRRVADELAADFGRRLGLIFYVLKRDTAVTLKANPWYAPEDFDRWCKVRSIYLVGGLANGSLGKAMADNAQKLLCELGIPDVSVKTGAYPSYAQFMGISRLTDGTKTAALFDFGHTFVKSAAAFFNGGKLSGIAMRPKIPSQYMGKGFANKDDELSEAKELHKFITDVIVKTVSSLGEDVSSVLPVSIANNVTDGRINGGGCYYKLMYLGDNYAELLSRDVSERLGMKVEVSLVHDGKAAALCFEDEADTVAVALGTAFGVGFTDGLDNLTDIEDTVNIAL